MSKAKVILIVLAVLSLILSFGAGCALGAKTPEEAGLGKVEEVWNIVFQDYVERDKLDANALREGAIEGMLEALNDPYSTYLDAETYQLSLSNLEGKFEGIGARVTVKEEQLIVVAPIEDTPAEKAGIKAGDIILEISGESAQGLTLEEAVLKIRGPKGTPVRLLVLHQGETEAEEIEIIRGEIEVPSIHFEMKGDIAYIRISEFSRRTSEELAPFVESIVEEAVTGIILDLRSNLGGVLQETVDVAGYFLREGVVVRMVDNRGQETHSVVEASQLTTDLPMVVLVDSFTASGGEVLAGALQDYDRAIVAGSKTFGKGSVNILRQLGDGSGLYITTARWLTPKGRPIEGEGIAPDYELELNGEDAIRWAIDYLKGSE